MFEDVLDMLWCAVQAGFLIVGLTLAFVVGAAAAVFLCVACFEVLRWLW